MSSGNLYRTSENGISQQALEGPAEHLNEMEGRSARGGSEEGECLLFGSNLSLFTLLALLQL